MRFTIERLRTLVLAAGVLLLVALGVFLAIGKWKNLLTARDIPKRLGVDIEQEANGVTYTQSHGGHTLFKIHASRVEQLKNSHSLLHNVTIDLYGQDGRSVDRIAGNDFEYNQQTGIATAAGKVEITLVRPGEALAVAPNKTAAQAVNNKPNTGPLAQSAAAGAIHVETSGLSFNQKTGVASTAQPVEFSLAKGNGSAIGASYDSQQGELVLDRSVELTTTRGGQPVTIHARHADFERGDQICTLLGATADYRGGQATASLAKILFRGDGSAQRLDALNGLTLSTATGSHLSAPTGSLDFDAHNQPQHGDLEGGVKLDSVSVDRQLHGTAPSALLDFSPQGELRLIELNRGAQIQSESTAPASAAQPVPLQVTRTWRSPVAEVAFRNVGRGQVEPAAIHGSGGVVVTAEMQRGSAAPIPSRLAADEIAADFGPGSVLTRMTGTGHASLEQTTAEGARQTATGDRLEAHFEPTPASRAIPATPRGSAGDAAEAAAAQIQSAVLEGHVVFIQQPALKPGAQVQPPLRATASRADYDGAGEWLHLTESPRIENGDFVLTAQKIDVSQQSGEAFAHGDVKATWFSNAPPGAGSQTNVESHPKNADLPTLGNEGPAHVVAEEAQLNQNSGEAAFRGRARLWQQANSIAGPLIVLDRRRQTLVARSANPAEPVRAVLLSAGAPTALAQPQVEPIRDARGPAARQSQAPSVIRVRGAEFTYSDPEHKAVMIGGVPGPVVAQTAGATCTANEVVLLLEPPEKRGRNERSQSQVERMTASGHVVISSEGRHGVGVQLVYTGATGDYVLTGTPSAPPRLTDPARGTVTGEALIFNSRDDSVSIEGGGRETTTQTTAPK